jgi:hypothetical protein
VIRRHINKIQKELKKIAKMISFAIPGNRKGRSHEHT